MQEKINLILSLFSSGETQAALDSAKDLIKDFPNEEILFNIIGACYASLGDHKAAIKNYEKAIIIKPDYAKAHFNLGGTFQDMGQLDSSVKSYEKAIDIEPNYAEAHNNIGNVLRELGQLDSAIRYYEKTLLINPMYIEAHYSLGSIFEELGQLNSAVKCYEEVLVIKPEFAEMHNNLGVVLQNQGQLIDAVKHLEKAVTIKPNFAEAYNNLGNIHKDLDHYNEAINCFEIAISIKSNYAEAHFNLGTSLRQLGQLEGAIKSLEVAVSIKANYGEAIHLLNALTGKTTKSPPKEYVEKLFDDYADVFDDSLVEQLQYKLPFLITELVNTVAPSLSKFNNVIDLGCGTGLAGQELRGISNRLTGVDLSNKMIIKAKERQVYDHLITGDISKALNNTIEKYDLFVALDVLIYIGEVSSIFKAIRNCCSQSAIFIFSIEVQTDGDYSLLKTGRYSHSVDYILRNSSDRFKLLESREVKLRKDNEKWITGNIICLQAN